MLGSDINPAYMKRTAELRTLKSFLIVAQEGSISRAAEVLNLTQPAISLQIKRLSEDTGLTLFNRTSKGMLLTRDGEMLLAKAEKVFDALTDFGDTAKRISGRVRGKLRIGTIVDPDFIRLGQLLALLVEGYPDLRTELSHGVSGQVISRLLRDQIDAGYFLGELADMQTAGGESGSDLTAVIQTKTLTDITYNVLAPAGWDARVTGRDWKALAQLPWVGTPHDSVHSRILDKVFAAHGCVQNKVTLVDQEASMLAMVRSGVGLSLCRDAVALEERQSRGLVIADQVTVTTPLSFATLRSRSDDPAIKAAIETLDAVWGG